MLCDPEVTGTAPVSGTESRTGIGRDQTFAVSVTTDQASRLPSADRLIHSGVESGGEAQWAAAGLARRGELLLVDVSSAIPVRDEKKRASAGEPDRAERRGRISRHPDRGAP